jgi:hypothetical protein
MHNTVSPGYCLVFHLPKFYSFALAFKALFVHCFLSSVCTFLPGENFGICALRIVNSWNIVGQKRHLLYTVNVQLDPVNIFA